MSVLRQLIPPAGPIRTLCVSHLGKTSANGILVSVAVLYFTRTVHLSPAQVGLALSIGAGCGLLAAVPAGRLADAIGPRDMSVWFLCLLGVFACGYPLVDDFAGLVIVSGLVMATESATDASTGALLAGLVPPADRVRAMSYWRSSANLSIGLGAAAGGVGIYLDTHAVYLGLFFGAAGLFVVSGLTYLRVARVAPVRHTGDGPSWAVVRDGPYALACLLNAVLFMNSGILLVALPIWISTRTSAPTWLFPVTVIINATIVVLFQTWSSRGSEEVAGGARTMRLGGFLLAGACALTALTAGAPLWLAVTLLLAGALVHVAGEMLHAVGSWSLAFGLAPEHAQGQYQGLFAMSTQLGQLLAPALVTLLLIGWGSAGWLVFGALFAVAGAVTPAAARWGLRRQPIAVQANEEVEAHAKP